MSTSPFSNLSTIQPKRNYAILTRVIMLITLFFLYTTALAGPIRYFLASRGLSFLTYLPQILMILVIVGYPFFTHRINKLFLATLFLVLFLLGISWINIGKPQQIFFGVYVLLPLFYGIVVQRRVLSALYAYRRWLALLFIITVVGVLLNYFVLFPWSGFTYSLGRLTIVGSRFWTTVGLLRLSGFARASFSAASEILLLAIILTIFSKHPVIRIFIWLIAGIAILMTTTKSLLGAFLLISIFLVVRRWFTRQTWFFLPGFLLLIGILVPLSTLFVSYQFEFKTKLVTFMLASFGDRLVNLWPRAFDLLVNYGNILFGRGIGGIGVAANYFESDLYSPGDNLFVYLYLMIGFPSIILLIFYLRGMLRLNIHRFPYDRLIFMFVLAVLAFGLTTNVIEEPYFSFSLGMSCSYMFGKFNKRFPLDIARENLNSNDPNPTRVSFGNRAADEQYHH